MTSIDDAVTQRLSWRINDWLREAGHPFSRPTLYNEIHRGKIVACKAAGNTIILTSPRDYFASLPRKLDPTPRHRKK
jgi:hypothetical protein